jgi:hypothetical protein
MGKSQEDSEGLWLLDQVPAFRHVTAPEAPTYRAIMHAFYEAKQRYLIELRPADVMEAIRRSGLFVSVADAEGLGSRWRPRSAGPAPCRPRCW